MDQTLDLRAYLRSLDATTLADLLAEQAERDPDLHDRLTLRAGEAAETARVGAVLDTVRRLLDAGSQADLAPLARRTVDRVVKTEDHAEFPRAIGLYARACAVHPPEPAELAEWLSGLVFAGYHVELAEFGAVLGDSGIARLKSIVDERRPEHEQVADLLSEQLAEISGDIDTLLDILYRRPPSIEVNRKLMRALRAAGRTADAISLLRGGFPRAAGQSDAIAEHKSEIDVLIGKGPAHYAEAASRLRKLRTLFRQAGSPGDFADYLTRLLATHKRKTRLLTEIRNARIALPKS